ncbi:MAG: glycosyltransferase family 39 protein [Candidatus Margulisbacteria bacterium]|jgi:hypothetical protein|nr:glycosyltransferase family 39 protein [Candidatus Margulisiibacteriota bacterium]
MKTLLLKIKQAKLSWWFILALVVWLGLALYGAFSDLNVSIQEGTNIYDELRPETNYTSVVNSLKWFFGGKSTGHQYLYHLTIFCLAKIFGLTGGLSFVLLGRIISIVCSILSVISVKYFVKKNLPKHNPESVALLQMFHPLFFFYSMQAEPYALLFFWTILHLILYFNLQDSRKSWQILAFGAVTILGYYTHFYFLLILFAEILTELYKFLKKQKILIWPFFLLLCLMPLLFWQIPVALNSSLKYFIDGYFVFSLGLCLKIFGVLFGLTPLFFSTGAIYLLTICLFCGAWLIYFYQHKNLPVVFGFFYLLLFCAFVFVYGIFASYGFTYPTMRHYIGIILPLTIILLSWPNKKIIIFVSLIVLSVFAITDVLLVREKYKPDGISAGNYITGYAGSKVILLSPAWAYYSLNKVQVESKDIGIWYYSKHDLHLKYGVSINSRIEEIFSGNVMHFAHISEYVLGLDNVDTQIQDEGLQDLLRNPAVKLIDTKEFANIKIYTFRKQ